MVKLEDLSYILPASLTDKKIKFGLFGAIIVLFVVCVILAIILGLSSGGTGSPRSAALSTYDGSGFKFLPYDSDACASIPCLETSAQIVENRDTSVAPCDNFYKHACGGWEKRNSIPADHYELTVKGKLDEKGRERLREILEKPIVRNTASSTERKLKEFFGMCVHDYKRMKDAGKPLIDIIRTDIKGWYVLDPDNWSSRGWDLQDAMAEVLGEYHTSAIVSLSTAWNWRTKKGIIYIRAGGLGLHYLDYKRDDMAGTLEAYKDYMRDVVDLLIRDANVTLDASERRARIEQFVDDALGQEHKLAEMRLASRQTRRWWVSKSTTVLELERNFTQIRWRQILSKAYDGYPIADNTVVMLSPAVYHHMVETLLLNETDSRDRIMNNYLVWMLVSQYADRLSWEYQHARYTYLKERHGTPELQPTWDRCTRDVMYLLSSAVAAEYLKAHVGQTGNSQGEQMFQQIKASLIDQISNLQWMDDTTKDRAKLKMQSVNDTMGFPSTYFDDDFWDNMHARLVINTDDGYFRNYLNANRFSRSLRTSQMEAGSRFQSWRFAAGPSILGSIPYYSFLSNRIIIPASILHFPLFLSGAPKFLNYGALGSFIGEEMLEAISEYGRFWWTNGTSWDWWTVDTYADFTKAQNCYAKYFDGKTIGPFLVDGEQKTVQIQGRSQTWRATETIAGIRAGLAGYRRWTSNAGSETVPLGLNYTTEQAFFFSVAQARCYLRRPEEAYRYVALSNKIPEDIMLNAALSHIPEFAEAFSCSTSSNMVQDNTCKVF